MKKEKTSILRRRSRRAGRSARGAAMIEFVVVGTALTVLGLATVQYALLFFAKNQMNHAAFMAARAASMGHASLEQAKQAYARALVPMYGGGRNAAELNESFAKAQADINANTTFELLNPTKESFDDYNDPMLQATVGKGKAAGGGDARVISNTDLATKPVAVGPTSGQTIQDANLLKLKVTQGYEPKVPLMKTLFGERVQVANVVTLQMHTDAIEPQNPVSSPGEGNNGAPQDPNPPQTPPSSPNVGNPPQTPVDTGAPKPPTEDCPEGATEFETAPADVLFDFDSATLNERGQQMLDAIIAEANHKDFESLTIAGYTDPLGTAAYNERLSLARANAVKAYLQSHGFPDKPIQTEGRGAQDPIKTLAQCPAGPGQISCLAPDRRVVFQFNGVN